ncbi:MAG: alpha/beta hydrolase-fold protein [Spirochaetota bacterium]
MRSFFFSSLASLLLLVSCAGAPAIFREIGLRQSRMVDFTVEVPGSTPASASLYIASNVNGWNPRDERFALVRQPDGTWAGSFAFESGTELEYKITRGIWEFVEKAEDGSELPNRQLVVPAPAAECRIEVKVGTWRDQVEKKAEVATTVPGLEIVKGFHLAALGVDRTLRICLPPDYAETGRRYPVLYMHDGQNLFDAATSFAGEWKIDEALTVLSRRDEGNGIPLAAIVVGIDNGGSERLNEYSPFVDARSPRPRGSPYIESIVEDLKPWIDARYRTLAGREYTWIGGSSMGGLISLYALWSHPQTFSKALCFSSALMFGDHAMLELIKTKGISPDIAVYLDVGSREEGLPVGDQAMVEDSRNVYEALLAAGLGQASLAFVLDPKGIHNEGAWARRFPSAYEWMIHAPPGK